MPDLTHAALENWLNRYGAAWERRDADAAGALFTEDARYHENPYAEPFEGAVGVREYWENVTADQGEIDFTYEIVGVAEGTGIARWNSKFVVASTGAPLELDGVFLLEFEEDKCRVLREWWHIR